MPCRWPSILTKPTWRREILVSLWEAPGCSSQLEPLLLLSFLLNLIPSASPWGAFSWSHIDKEDTWGVAYGWWQFLFWCKHPPAKPSPQCWYGKHSQQGKTCHVSRVMWTNKTNKLFVVGCLFHDSFVTQPPFSSSWFFFFFVPAKLLWHIFHSIHHWRLLPWEQLW